MKKIRKLIMLCGIVSVSACMAPDTQPAQLVKKTKLAPKTKSTIEESKAGAIGKSVDFDRSVQLGGNVYANDADAIQRLISMPTRSPEEDKYLSMLARKYDFYGKPENIPSALSVARQKFN